MNVVCRVGWYTDWVGTTTVAFHHIVWNRVLARLLNSQNKMAEWESGCVVVSVSVMFLFLWYIWQSHECHKTSHTVMCSHFWPSQIGQQFNGHMIPAFLGEGLQKVLFGCLHSDYSLRLSAQDCMYLLTTSEAGVCVCVCVFVCVCLRVFLLRRVAGQGRWHRGGRAGPGRPTF